MLLDHMAIAPNQHANLVRSETASDRVCVGNLNMCGLCTQCQCQAVYMSMPGDYLKLAGRYFAFKAHEILLASTACGGAVCITNIS